ncbi:protein BCCIP homolog [Teleopsis dalmanni]|uniref:protein BCCIP homolog n=1 Tax=Teleopsis dalmanni TaxID=139649 RepID=UPI0018CFE068|nr:protein BCCIP homolog [Teleopsis dalmanni]
MSAPKRKATALELLEEPSSSSDVEEDVGITYDENDEEGSEEMVDFEGRAAYDSDCHGITMLLQRAYVNVDINLMELADLIISQNYVGSVLMQASQDDEEENETIFGVTTVINISKKKDKKCVQDLRSHILSCAKNNATPEMASKFEAILKNDKLNVGYILNERFVNIPCAISVPSFENLLQEINDAAAKGMPFKFDYMVIIIKYFMVDGAGDNEKEKILVNEEENLFEEIASDVFHFKLTSAAPADEAVGGESQNSGAVIERMVCLLEAKRFYEAVKKLDHFVNGPKPV